MKLAIISDIHSNLQYLRDVLDCIAGNDVDGIYCLGDLVGFYDKPNEVIEVIRDEGILCVKGNHDKFILSELDYDKSKESVYRIQHQRKLLTDENVSFLHDLPDELELITPEATLFFTHSMPGDASTYVYKPDMLNKEFLSNYQYYCLGHTHIPLVSVYKDTTIVNPGSVGQPRDYSTNSSYALLDIAESKTTLNSVYVDNEEYSRHLKELDYPNELIHILNRTNDG